MRFRGCQWLWAAVLAATVAGCAPRTTRLAGFQVSSDWAEQIRELTFEPEVRVHLNAPAESDLDPRRPTMLVLYALPNGNSIEWTIGRKPAEGLDWHYTIQHIGAQTRRLREVVTDCNIVVAYLESAQKSWPSWRQKYKDRGDLIPGLVARIRRETDLPRVSLVFSGHSGGGSFIFGYLDGVERIPDDVERISFLDSNYGYSDESQHGTKLLAWLRSTQDHVLTVLAYDDREIKLNGKKVVGPTGGTWRATGRMLDRFRTEIPLATSEVGDLTRYRGLEGRVDIIVHRNPHNRILHTALVGDMNGFIHALTSSTPYENTAGVFGGPVAYSHWIAD